ncbi:MAG: DUF924 domain-containing protein [Rhodobacteraceae bacterium]|nr:DUF924 domain-containing protein [Paracoccaceae bacterium]
MGISHKEVLDFWQNEVTESGWYVADDAVDTKIRDRYLEMWQSARDGGYDHWGCRPEHSLALLIVLDQFPRNMFRGSSDSFATDAKARKIAKRAIYMRNDLKINKPMRQFFYLPLMHSEVLADQDTGVRMYKLRMDGGDTLLHPRAHRQVIRQFGRFPYRNDALGRKTTPAEQEYLEAGAYMHTLQTLEAQDKR